MDEQVKKSVPIESGSASKSQKAENVKYDPSSIELKWQAKWQKDKTYQPDMDTAKKPFFNLMMFPYPSAEGMHVGNMYAFTGTDIYGRYKRMQGYDVFEPIGLDGFGIHSENYAMKVGRHPMENAKKAEENFYRQLRATGNAFAWDRTVETWKPEYYHWTQWVFIQLFKAGLAYRKKAAVNFCPSCKTVLSDEQAEGGKCERCGSVVERRELEQWFFKITTYADRLLKNLDTIDWADKVKIAQRKWIGKKEGINITYEVEGKDVQITVFTTRPDTNYGATFIAIAPEHPLIEQLTTPEQKAAVAAYIKETTSKSDEERQAEGREKTGVFTGSYAINQLTGYKMPIWISDFVLGGFGTGALVGVPAHDKRDFEFAQKFDLEIKRVVVGKDDDISPVTKLEQVQEEEGTMVNSDFLDGMDIHDATAKIMDYMEEKGYGKREVSYHLRDWLISRQRYWGPPIPMIYCEHCAKEGKSYFTENPGKIVKEVEDMAGWYPVPDEQLPVELPHIEDFKPLGTGKAPLANYPEFYTVNCPSCGKEARRETDVSDTFLDSAWYFFRYTSTEDTTCPWKPERAKKWLPVHMYIGGAEHSVLHLLYARFVTMVFKDLGLISHFEEPFSRFYAHGLLIKEGAKMSKSKGNVIIPDDYIRKFGADTLRTYLMFLGPFKDGGDFYDTGIEGVNKFLKRVWTLMTTREIVAGASADATRALRHKTIKEVTDDMEQLRYNTAIAKLMTYYNTLADQKELSREDVVTFLKLLAPFAPHVTEELWSMLGETASIHTSAWPTYDEKETVADTVVIAVQVNGKVRDSIEVPAASEQGVVEQKAKESAKISGYLQGQTVKKVIFVQNKIINFVI